MNSFLVTALAAIFVFGLLITSHELGHFIMARLSGITVLEFAIGMGPKLFSFKKGETLYTLRVLPIGGYNKMLGEQEKSDSPKAFSNKSPWKRLVVIVAGAFMNFLIAIVIFFLVSYNVGIIKPTVSSTTKNFPAAKAGIQTGDKLISVNGAEIQSWNGFINFVSENSNKPFDLVVKRNGEKLSFHLIPELEQKDKRYIVGIYGTNIKGNFIESAKNGVLMTGTAIKDMVMFLNKLVRGKVSTAEVGGPVKVVELSGQFAQAGFWSLLYFIGFLSINLGVFNLIPFPALDGGWVIILLYEGITRKKIDENKIGFVNFIGFAVLMCLIVLITFKDIFGKSAF